MDANAAVDGEPDYDVALSFAGEDQDYVEDVATRLKARGVRVFFYEDVLAETWGKNLAEFLHEIYNRRARYAIIFISQSYVSKKWTTHERRSAQDRALEQASPYILPVRLDDAEVPGMHSSIAHVDARRLGIEELVNLIVRKLDADEDDQAVSRTGDPQEPRHWPVPATAAEIAKLVSERPPAWEYILFAAILQDESKKIDDKYRDHVIEYSRPTSGPISDREVLTEIRRSFYKVQASTEFLERLFSRDAQESAFGKPGESGDADRIRHLARRTCSLEEDLLDWAAAIRATPVESDEARRVMSALARYADQPIEEVRTAIARIVDEADTLNERVMSGENVSIQIAVTFEVPEGVSENYAAAFKKLEQRLSG